MKPLSKDTEFFKGLFKKFDKGLTTNLDRFSRQINVSIQKVEQKLRHAEERMLEYIDLTKRHSNNELRMAEILVNKELRTKIIMSQWTNKFVASSREEHLDPITFAFARFSLNICISFQEVHPMYILETNIHKHLVDYIKLEPDIAVGPALMALVHISLYDELKVAIVAAGALPALLKLMVYRQSKPILTQAAKLCASLVTEPSNKTLMAQSGCMHALFDLILGAHQDVDRHVQYATLCAIVNVIYMSDANRLLSIELTGIRPLLTTLQTTSHDDIMIQAIRALTNIAFGNGFTANSILVAGGGEVLVEVLESGDIMRQPLIAHAVLAAFSNICNSEVNQSHIGSIKGLLEIVIRLCEHCREVYLATEAANFLLACCWKNTINKARIANKDGCTVLMKRIIRHSVDSNHEDIACTSKMCLALSSVLLYLSNHERMIVNGGLEECIRLCKVVSEPQILRGLSKVISTMVPNPEDLLRVHLDDNKYHVEKMGAVQVLKKAKLKGFHDAPKPPVWLQSAIDVLSASDDGLKKMPPRLLTEFVDKSEFSQEFPAPVHPDSTVLDTKDFRGLLFSIY